MSADMIDKSWATCDSSTNSKGVTLLYWAALHYYSFALNTTLGSTVTGTEDNKTSSKASRGTDEAMVIDGVNL